MKVDIGPMLRTFNLSRRATAGQVQNAYRQLARKWHPDRCAQTGETPESAAIKMREINRAREMLLAHTGYAGKAVTADRGGDRPGSGRYPEKNGYRIDQDPGSGPLEGTLETPRRRRSRDLVKAAGRLLEQGRVSKSLALCNQALRFDRRNAAVYSQRGSLFRATGKHALALKDFSRAVKLAPDHVDALVQRGDTYCDLGYYNRAMADYNTAIRIDPEGSRALRGRARLLFKTRHYAGAVADMRRALAL